jgi:hypothetical protein
MAKQPSQADHCDLIEIKYNDRGKVPLRTLHPLAYINTCTINPAVVIIQLTYPVIHLMLLCLFPACSLRPESMIAQRQSIYLLAQLEVYQVRSTAAVF